MPERLASLISGGGTTMNEMIKACQSGEVPMEVACVIASRARAGGIEKAQKLNVPVEVVDPRAFKTDGVHIDREAFGKRMLEVLSEHGATVVTQNGWMPLTPPNVIEAFPGKIFNQHPGAPELFGGKGMYGRRVHATVLLYRRLMKQGIFGTEVIAQRVDPKFDQGAVVKAARVNILPEDTVDDLQQRALPIEHQVQIALLRDIAKGTVEELDRSSHEMEVYRVHNEPDVREAFHVAQRMAMLLYPQG